AVLYPLQAVLGGITVVLELSPEWVTLHLANAELLLATLTALAVVVQWPAAGPERFGGWTWLALAAAIRTFVLTLTRASAPWALGAHPAAASALWCSVVALTVLAWRPAAGQRALARDLIALTKPAIMSLLLVTALGGMFLAARGVPPFGVLAATLIGGAAAS